jgi:superfamily II DNA/RNA helicase
LQTTTFAELGLSAKVLAAIDAAGYPAPTPIQAQAIPVAVTGRDVLGIAQTGTGKTASFVLPMITRLETGRARARMPRSLILAPTRELAAQCAQSFEKYGVNHKLDVALLIGGVSMDDQVRKLDRGVDVLIATPGRLLDHFQRGRIMLMGVEILVIDEADRMLDMGFIPDIEKICKLLPPRRQTLFFSATMPPEITRLVDQFLNDPARIEVARPATTAKTITQRFCYCDSAEDWAKREVLRELLRSLDVRNAIIFCNRKKDVAILLKSLTKHGFNAGALHGDMDQMSRMATLDKFRAGEIAFLAASDVAARGLDIPDVSHVINYDVPWQADDYVHRIGRTGRAGKEGFSATIVTSDDIKAIDSIAKLIGEEPKWIGEPPDEAAFADGRSRKRRGRGAPAVRGRPEARGGRSGDRGERGSRRDVPERREASRRIARTDRPEIGDQPEIADDSIVASRRPVRRRERAPQEGDVRRDEATRVERAPPEARSERQAQRPEHRSERPPAPPQRGGETRGAEGKGGGRSAGRDGRGHQRGADEATPLAFGDHMPAFLKRPVRVSAD